MFLQNVVLKAQVYSLPTLPQALWTDILGELYLAEENMSLQPTYLTSSYYHIYAITLMDVLWDTGSEKFQVMQLLEENYLLCLKTIKRKGV